MSLPNLPTNNLYSFFAIGGLLLVVYSLSLIHEAYASARNVALESLHAERLLNFEMQRYLDNLERLKEFLDYHATQSATISDAAKANFNKALNNSAQDETDIKRKLVDIEHTRHKSDVAEILLANSLKLAQFYYWLGWIVAIVATVLWYYKVQRPQDEILRGQSLKRNKRLRQSTR